MLSSVRNTILVAYILGKNTLGIFFNIPVKKIQLKVEFVGFIYLFFDQKKY